jgi:cell shape-determining protein MreD
VELFPTIHTNFWDAVIAVPVIMIITQILKKFFHIKPFWVPTIALIIGLLISIFISHRHNLLAGIFMGWFYGYAAIGSYASLKTSWMVYKQRKAKKVKS